MLKKIKTKAKPNEVLRGTKLNYNISLQLRYERELRLLVEEMIADTTDIVINRIFKTKDTEKYIKQQTALDASVASNAKQIMNALTARFTQLFSDKAAPMATNMVDGAAKNSEVNLKQSLKTLSGGMTINTGAVPKGMEEVTKASVAENVSLIKSIPQEYLKNVTGEVMRSITSASGLKYLVPKLKKYGDITERRAKMIALDQTRKAYNNINKQRMTKVGIKKFEWLHSGGSNKPRKSHIKLSGKIFSFDKLPIINQEQVDAGSAAPERGIPGQAINCRCTMTPVIEFEEDE